MANDRTGSIVTTRAKQIDTEDNLSLLIPEITNVMNTAGCNTLIRTACIVVFFVKANATCDG